MSFGSITKSTPSIPSAGEVAVNYFVTINQLSARNAPLTAEEQAPIQTSTVTQLFAPFAPYAPYLLFVVLFYAALTIQLMNKVKTVKTVFIAILLALFAASIPTVLTFVEQGSRQNVHAGPEEVPRMIQIKPQGTNGISITWTTDADLMGIVKISKKPLTDDNGNIYLGDNREKVKNHTVIVDNLLKRQTYQIMILSGNSWYDNGGAPIEFIFK